VAEHFDLIVVGTGAGGRHASPYARGLPEILVNSAVVKDVDQA